MDLTPYVDSLRHDLVVAAESGGDDTRAVVERLFAPLESATRLVLLEALSAAADDITRDLAPGSVEVRLRGRDPEFAVTPPPAEPTPVPAAPDEPAIGADEAPAGPEGDDGGTARITLRLPSHLKPRIDEAAGRAGLSANAWLVRVVAAALQPDGQAAAATGPSAPAHPRPGPAFGRRYTGWVQ